VKAVLALDLDQTLIYSERSAGRAKSATDVWVEDYDGKPLSFMTGAAHQLLADASARHHVVPVTTRTPEQYGRIRLPGRQEHAICANGGVLLVDGERDPEWDRRVQQALADSVPAGTIRTRLARVEDSSWVSTVRQVEDLFVYLVATHRSDIPPAWLADTTAWCAGQGWVVSLQGRKVYAVPSPLLCKGDAAARLAERLGGPLLAAGDSLLDSNLLDRALVAIRPAHGELHHRYGDTPRLRVTERSGAEAAEDILTYLGGVADDLVAPVRL
jgi:hypothetical protein